MATRQKLQLAELNFEYQTFRKNQLLTHDHLNSLISFFEDQSRLTRTCLIGVGVVCGLTAKLNSNQTITVSKGCGVTTDGDLLILEQTTFGFYRSYLNKTHGKEQSIYDPFFPPSISPKQVDLWELVQEGTEPGAFPLNTFGASTGNVLSNMVAMLYLEYYEQDAESCTSIKCDNQGLHQYAKPKVLLLSQADMDKVINSEANEIIADSIYKSYYDAFTRYYDLPVLQAKRVILNKVNTAGLKPLTNAYLNIVQGGAAALVDAVVALYNHFQFILDPTQFFGSTRFRNGLTALFNKTVQPHQVQYFYDFYKDVIDTYNELRETIYGAIYVCCPDKYAFPKHLMLGKLNGPLGPKPPKYRHAFYASPAVTKNKERLSVARSILNRLNDMMEGFSLPPDSKGTKITPSLDAEYWTDRRAMPFYYKNAAQLVQHWSNYKTLRGMDKQILSYHAGQYSSNDAVVQPLDYNIDSYNFFRVEGHIGKKMREAMEEINELKESKSLPFDLVAIRLEEGRNMEINMEDYNCQFEDLNTFLNSWIAEQNCLYARVIHFLSAFDSKLDLKIRDKQGITSGLATIGERFEGLVANRSTEVIGTMLSLGNQLGFMGSYLTERKDLLQRAFYSGEYKMDDLVERNVSNEEDTIGKRYTDYLKGRKNVKATEIIGIINEMAEKDPAIKGLGADEKEIGYSIPMKLIALIKEITLYKPFSLNELNTDVLEKYKAATDALCKEAKESYAKLERLTHKTGFVRKGYESKYLSTIADLITNCCSAEKLEIIMEEIKKRKKEILQQLSLPKYAAKHPGLEHKAGVPRGGTFVLLYTAQKAEPVKGLLTNANRAVEVSERKTILSKKQFREKKATGEIYGLDEDTFLYNMLSEEGDINIEEEIKTYLIKNEINLQRTEGKARYRELFSKAAGLIGRIEVEAAAAVANEVVVADFCLPYICCSDCPPVAFILPKQKFTLALPKTVVCSNEERLEFKKEPADGTVETAEEFKEAIITEGTRTYFDPTKIKEGQFGKEISFTINAQLTDCTIKVIKHPKADFSFKVLEDNAERIRVEFENKSDDESGKLYEYEWDFGGGKEKVKTRSKSNITIDYRKKDLGNTAFIKVSLIAYNGTCIDEAEPQNIPVVVNEEVGLTLEKNKACQDDPPVRFTKVVPANATVKCREIEGVIRLEGDKLVFDPKVVLAGLYGTSLTFTVNDIAVPASITVFKKPIPIFTITNIKRDGDELHLGINNATDTKGAGKVTFAWTFNDGSNRTDDAAAFSHKVNLRAITNGKPTVSLTVTNGICAGETDRKEVDIPENNHIECHRFLDDEFNLWLNELQLSIADNQGGVTFSRMSGPIKNPDIKAIAEELIGLMKRVVQNLNKLDTLDVQLKLLDLFASFLKDRLLKLKVDSEEDKISTSDLLRGTLMGSFNLTRCLTKVENETKEKQRSIIELIIRAGARLVLFFPALNTKDQLVLFLNSYSNSFVAQDEEVKKLITTLIKLISELFPR